MSLPPLTQWQNTRRALHHAAQVVGGVRRVAIDPLPNWAHLGLFVTSDGLTTGPTPVGALTLNLMRQSVEYQADQHTPVEIGLAGHNQVTLTDAVLKALLDAGYNITLDREKLADESAFNINPGHAAGYAQALHTMFTALARFRARLIGPMSPMIVWPHGFDLSFLWFSGAGMEEDKDPHMNFGFSPGSPGLERPYIYSYVWPRPDGLTALALPAPARWHTEGWVGVVIDYDALNPNAAEEQVESLLHEVYNTIEPLMRS